jgi:hypothetical protein
VEDECGDGQEEWDKGERKLAFIARRNHHWGDLVSMDEF